MNANAGRNFLARQARALGEAALSGVASLLILLALAAPPAEATGGSCQTDLDCVGPHPCEPPLVGTCCNFADFAGCRSLGCNTSQGCTKTTYGCSNGNKQCACGADGAEPEKCDLCYKLNLQGHAYQYTCSAPANCPQDTECEIDWTLTGWEFSCYCKP